MYRNRVQRHCPHKEISTKFTMTKPVFFPEIRYELTRNPLNHLYFHRMLLT